jgi:hypothetical protein
MARIISLLVTVDLVVTPIAWEGTQQRCQDLDKSTGTQRLLGLNLAVASEIWTSPESRHFDDVSIGWREVRLRYYAHEGMKMSEIGDVQRDLQGRLDRVVAEANARLAQSESEPSERVAEA